MDSDALENHLKELIASNRLLTQALEQSNRRLAVLENLEAQRADAAHQARVSKERFDTFAIPDRRYPQDIPNVPRLHVRIKPYNKAQGYLRMGQFFDEINRVLKGGTGNPGDIPEWVEVSRDQACSLVKHRQRANHPMSPPVVDILTPEEREIVDTKEEQYRSGALGISAMAALAAQGRAEQPGLVRARGSQVDPTTLGGRAAAMQGLDVPPPAPPAAPQGVQAPAPGVQVYDVTQPTAAPQAAAQASQLPVLQAQVVSSSLPPPPPVVAPVSSVPPPPSTLIPQGAVMMPPPPPVDDLAKAPLPPDMVQAMAAARASETAHGSDDE